MGFTVFTGTRISLFDFGEDATIFIVCQGHDSQDWRPVLSKRGDNGLGWQFRKTNTDYASFTIRGTSDWDDRRGGTAFNGSAHVWSLRKSSVGKSQWADGNLEFEVVDTGHIAPAPDDDLVVGARDQNGITAFANVEVGEILIFDAALSNPQVQQIQGYLAHKWGLDHKLPSSHPYKLQSPVFENRPQILIQSPFPLLLDQNVSLVLATDRPADFFGANNLPSGLSLDSSSGIIYGNPSEIGDFYSEIESSNFAGSQIQSVTFQVRSFSDWPFSLSLSFDGYQEPVTVNNIPVYVELNSSISGFSYEQFSSVWGHDLRFLTADGSRELKYEVVNWDPLGTSSFWVLLPELNATTSIVAVWGNPSVSEQPDYCKNGSVWSKYRGVWHMDEKRNDLIIDSRGSFHATPNNFDTLRVTGLMGSALNFDGENDYLNMALDSHPPDGTNQLTISFWTYGRFQSLVNSTLFESGSSLGRHLNVHFPGVILDSIGMQEQVLMTGSKKEDASYLNQWIFWTLQKEVDLGVMRIFKNGDLFAEAFNRTRPIGGGVDLFKIGSARTGGLWWKGWLDEFRIGLFVEDPNTIKAHYLSQKPGAVEDFISKSTVEGHSIIVKSQLAEGYANDASRTFSYFIETFPSANTFSVVGLPAGLSYDENSGEISGIPLQGGQYRVTVSASNAYGTAQGSVDLRIASLSSFSHYANFDFSGYDGNETLLDFPVFITFDSSISKFSLKSFASTKLNDLRFYDDVGRELSYEIEVIEPDANRFSVWVRVPEMNASNSIAAYWGNENLAAAPPNYAVDGSTWSNDFTGVWHYRPMSLTTTLTDSSPFRNHADDAVGLTLEESILGSGRTLSGNPDQYIQVANSYSLDALDQQSFTFSTWIKMGKFTG